MLELTKQDLQAIALDKVLKNAKQDKNIPDMLNRLANALQDNDIVICKDDGKPSTINMGQIMEAFVKSLKTGSLTRWAKCYNPDYEDGNGSWEIKTSLNVYNLCTALKSPQRTIFITNTGAYALAKKDLEEIFQNPYDYQDYIKITDSGLRLKPSIKEIGKPISWINKALGF